MLQRFLWRLSRKTAYLSGKLFNIMQTKLEKYEARQFAANPMPFSVGYFHERERQIEVAIRERERERERERLSALALTNVSLSCRGYFIRCHVWPPAARYDCSTRVLL